MSVWKWPGWVWLEHTGENAARAAAVVALSFMTPGGETNASWQTVAIMSAKAAVYAVLLAVAGLRQPNGTDSFLRSVVAARPRRRRPARRPRPKPQAPTTADLNPRQ